MKKKSVVAQRHTRLRVKDIKGPHSFLFRAAAPLQNR